MSTENNSDAGTLVVAVQSHKGGVGKTTMGLAIARAYLAETERPVVVLDADLLGTDVADLCHGANLPVDGRYRLGLLDMLTQATGGNTTFDAWLRGELEALRPTGPTPHRAGLPYLPLSPERGCVVIPTLRETSPSGRRQEREGLARCLVTDSFGLAQVERRLATLLGRLMKAWCPAAVVIDCSPFHLAVGKAVQRVFKAALNRAVDATLPRGVRDALEGGRYAMLEVVGPEISELAVLQELGEPDESHRDDVPLGVVINRDTHGDGWGGHRACALLQLLAQFADDNAETPAVPAWMTQPHVLHVPHQAELAYGALGHLAEPAVSSDEAPAKRLDRYKLALDVTGSPDLDKAFEAQFGGLAALKPLRWSNDPQWVERKGKSKHTGRRVGELVEQPPEFEPIGWTTYLDQLAGGAKP